MNEVERKKEKVFVEYNITSGFVRAVHPSRPPQEKVSEGFAIAEYPEGSLRPGVEVDHVVFIDPEGVEDGEIRSHYATRVGPPQENINRRLNELETRLEALEKVVNNA